MPGSTRAPRQAREEVFEVWSVRAVIRLEDVEALEMKGALQPGDCVPDGDVTILEPNRRT
jgi:hypothetical protein